MHSEGDAAERIVLPAVFDDDVGHGQRSHAVGATEADSGELRLRQDCCARRLYHSDAHAIVKSGAERISTAILWVGFRSHRTVRHDGNRLRAGSSYDYRPHSRGGAALL